MKSKSVEKTVAQGLKKAEYKSLEKTQRDILATIKAFTGLVFHVEKFVFDNGDENLLAHVKGTIPISYKSNTYNIPVCFWLPRDYPKSGPMGFIQPTSDMQIKASPNVDQNGRVQLPYLLDWNYPDSNLVELIQLCILIFGKAPPVFSKSKSNRNQGAVVNLPSPSSTTNGLSRQTSLQEAERSACQNGGERPNPEDELKDEHIRISLVSCVSDKIRSRLSEEFQKTVAECQSLHHTNKDLLDGQEKLAEIVKNIESRSADLESILHELRQQKQDLLAKEKQLSEIDLDTLNRDEIVEPVAPEHAPLVHAYATDGAIEDALFSLLQAYQNGKMDCQTYLKKVRQLSRKQFQQRYILSQKRAQQSRSSSESQLGRYFDRSFSTASNPP